MKAYPNPLIYVIPGEPMSYAYIRYGSSRVWDSQKEQRMYANIVIEGQHGERPLYKGPLELCIKFYLRPTRPKSALIGQFHTNAPKICDLLEVLNDACKGILYENECMISRIVTEKKWDSVERTEFYLKQLSV